MQLKCEGEVRKNVERYFYSGWSVFYVSQP